MGKQVVIQKGGGDDLFVYFHIEPTYIADQAKAATDDTVVAELWGLGTSAYRAVMPGYGGWKKYVASLAKKVGRESFDHTCLTTWSAGSAILFTVCRGADLPDAIVSCDGIYGSKPPGAKAGDGRVVFTQELEAVARYALAAARGEKLFVLMHSSISTPYGSSGECAAVIRSFVEQEMGVSMHDDDSISAEDLDGHQFGEALVLGNFHLIEFPGIDAKEHVREGHLFDEVWKKWIPWVRDSRTTDPSPPMDDDDDVAAARWPEAMVQIDARGPAVERWQTFLVGQGAPIKADGVFGPRTMEATKAFQRRHRITDSGDVDEPTLDAAAELGFMPTAIEHAAATATIPPKPAFMPIVGNMERAAIFGRFAFVSAPQPGNPEAIRITDGWKERNIVKVAIPQISSLQGAPKDGVVEFHKRVAERARELFAKWEEADLLSRLITWDGSYVARFVRGSRTTLSNHSFGSAFDCNARWNALGTAPTPAGVRGSVIDLVGIANELGWYWGGHFSRVDGMHFEVGRI